MPLNVVYISKVQNVIKLFGLCIVLFQYEAFAQQSSY